MARSRPVLVEKSTGEKVPFDLTRLQNSLARSGASDKVIKQISNSIEQVLFDGISTKEIYQKAFSMLRKSSRHTAARYKLKNAIYELGPSGFPFEKFIAAILSHEGFKTKVGVNVRGQCVNHEVDVVAEKGNKHFMVECKFHRSKNNFCDVKVPLYIHSRFHDIIRRMAKEPENHIKFMQGWVYTNTRFTSDAIEYGNCVGLKLVGWKYPKKGGLNERIDASGLHPITCLTSLTKNEKARLLDHELILCKQLCQSPGVLYHVGIPQQKHKKVLMEAHDLCGY